MSTIKDRFQKIRQQTEYLVRTLRPEDFVVQPIVDVSPPKWHLAHTTWFFEQFILSAYKKNYQLFDKDYNFLFNSYYESVGKRVLRADRGNLTRPDVEEILKYRAYVNDQMVEFLTGSDNPDHALLDVIELGLQHEQQHQELLVTDIKYILGHNPLFPAYEKKSGKTTSNFSELDLKDEYIDIEGGICQVGFDADGFHFDNERGVHKIYLQPFRLMNRLITVEEYLAFIEAGGYSDFRYWLMEGWEWVKQNKVKAPLYWHKIDAHWYHYTMHGLEKVDITEPVTHISYYEADAFASWKGKRLLSEFEWEIASKKIDLEINKTANFVNSKYFRPKAKEGNNSQLFGDTWEWTSSAYSPYPYFKKAEGAIGEYNGKFMINQMVLRGGSCATPKDHIRHTYRNFFHPHLRWQFTGIRLAEHI